jgi:hypothetical protein
MPPLLSVPEQYGDDITPNFDVFLLDENDVASATRNPYVKKSSEDSLLHILQPKRVKNAFENENKESNLFHLFVGRSLFEAILRWTNEPSRAMLSWMECQASDEKSWQER